jgi:hypothetical protein
LGGIEPFTGPVFIGQEPWRGGMEVSFGEIRSLEDRQKELNEMIRREVTTSYKTTKFGGGRYLLKDVAVVPWSRLPPDSQERISKAFPSHQDLGTKNAGVLDLNALSQVKNPTGVWFDIPLKAVTAPSGSTTLVEETAGNVDGPLARAEATDSDVKKGPNGECINGGLGDE